MTVELVGGPYDGARAESAEKLCEGQHLLVDTEEGAWAVYKFRNGILEFDRVGTVRGLEDG